MPLTEQHRAKLDSIVAQMEANGEPEDAVRFVVEDFKSKYSAGTAAQDHAALVEQHARNRAQSDPTFGQALGQFGSGLIQGAVELPGKVFGAGKGLYQMAGEEVRKNPTGGPMIALGKAGLALAEGIPAYAGEAAGRFIYGSPEDVGKLVGENAMPFVAGKALSTGGNLAGKGLKRVVGTPEEIYQSALKPSTTLSLEKRARILETGVSERIPVNRKGLVKARNVIEDIKQQVDDRLAQIAAESNPTVPTEAVARRIDEVKPKFQTVAPESDMNALEAMKQEFLSKYGDEIPITEAQKLKQNTYRKLKDKSYGEQKTATTEGEKALARGLKEELENIVPELKALNQREGSVIALEKSLTRAVARINNHQLFGIGTPAMGALGYAVGGAPGAAALAVLKLVLDNPTVKSNLSFALSRAKSLRAKAAPLGNTFGRGPSNEPPTTPPSAGPLAGTGGGANPGTGGSNQAVRSASLQPALQKQAATAENPIREEALSIIDAISEQYKNGLPSKTNEIIYPEIDRNGYGQGRGLRNWSGINVDDIPILQDVPHGKEAIERALKMRYGKVWDRIVKEAEDYVKRDLENPDEELPF